jgi:hypothetical protein
MGTHTLSIEVNSKWHERGQPDDNIAKTKKYRISGVEITATELGATTRTEQSYKDGPLDEQMMTVMITQ